MEGQRLMAIPREIIEEILYRTDIESLVGSYVSLKRSGSNLFGLCPFHSERSPSFSVSPGKKMFYCFGCGAGGDAITFVTGAVFGYLILLLPFLRPLAMGLPIAIVNMILSLLPTMVLRFNTPALRSLYRRNLAREQTKTQERVE